MTAFGAIEAGGTKFVCAIGTGPKDLRTIRRIPTSTPTETIPLVTGVFTSYQKRHHDLAAIGVGTFGPVDCLPASPTFGFIKKTPKPGWSNTELVGAIQAAVHLPGVIESDVNAAAFGEYVFGAGRGLDNVVYFNYYAGYIDNVFNYHNKEAAGPSALLSFCEKLWIIRLTSSRALSAQSIQDKLEREFVYRAFGLDWTLAFMVKSGQLGMVIQNDTVFFTLPNARVDIFMTF